MFLETIHKNLSLYNKSTAFFINGKKYSYEYFKKVIDTIIFLIKQEVNEKQNIIVIYVNNDIETYASILASWFTNNIFVPLNPKHPKSRNKKILNQIKPDLILTSTASFNKLYSFENIVVNTNFIKSNININVDFSKFSYNDLMYIFFTSGSTGQPKGVKISLKNLNSFIVDYKYFFNNLNNNDRFLQIYDLTFDASIPSFLFPLFIGASVYTVSATKVKYLEAYKIMKKYNITVAKFTPSMLSFLKSYFDKIHLPYIKLQLFGGEALFETDLLKWQKCIANAQIFNAYGPTEATVDTHFFNWTKHKNDNYLSNNNIVAIGKTFGSTIAVVVDIENNILENSKKGELCIAGNQITVGYFNNIENNKLKFFNKIYNNKEYRFYKTGDLVIKNDNENYYFLGRIDNQVQIQGYRVELEEIESVAVEWGSADNFVALAIKNSENLHDIKLICLNLQKDKKTLFQYLQKKLPTYMLPSEIIELEQFPINLSGKTDRNKIKDMIVKKNNIKQQKLKIETNLIQFYNSWIAHKDISTYKEKDFSAIINTKGKWLNFILNKNIDKQNFDENLIKIKKLISNNELPKKWIINSDITNFKYKELKKNNFFPITKWQGMYCFKDKIIENKYNENLNIVKITKQEQLESWLKIANNALNSNGSLTETLFSEILNNPNFYLYLATYKGVAVATSLLYVNNSIAGLYMIATDQNYRKKGFGTAITLYAINEAIKNEIFEFVLHSTKVGNGVYKKIGFADVNSIYIFAQTKYNN